MTDLQAAKINNTTLHHFFCEFEIPDTEQWYVNSTNNCKSIKEQLLSAKI